MGLPIVPAGAILEQVCNFVYGGHGANGGLLQTRGAPMTPCGLNRLPIADPTRELQRGSRIAKGRLRLEANDNGEPVA